MSDLKLPRLKFLVACGCLSGLLGKVGRRRRAGVMKRGRIWDLRGRHRLEEQVLCCKAGVGEHSPAAGSGTVATWGAQP